VLTELGESVSFGGIVHPLDFDFLLRADLNVYSLRLDSQAAQNGFHIFVEHQSVTAPRVGEHVREVSEVLLELLHKDKRSPNREILCVGSGHIQIHRWPSLAFHRAPLARAVAV
jgi:hypothetical protein